MSYLKKLILFILTPPGSIFILLILAMLAVISKRISRGAKRSIAWSCLILAYISSTSFISSPILYRMEHKNKDACEKADAIAVLSAGIELGQYSDNNSKQNESSFKRLIKGIETSRKNNTVLIILGGMTLKNEPAEAEVLFITAVDMGLKKDKIIIENNSKNSLQNIIELKKIAEEKGFKSIIVVTSALHSVRIEKILKKQGLDYCMLSTDYRAGKGLRLRDFIPSIKNMELNSFVIYEALALAKYYIMRAI